MVYLTLYQTLVEHRVIAIDFVLCGTGECTIAFDVSGLFSFEIFDAVLVGVFRVLIQHTAE